MIFNVLLDHLGGHVTRTDGEESARPQMLSPVSLAQCWKLLLQFAGTRPLHELHQLAQRYIRRVRYQEVYMLGGYHTGYDFGPVLGAYSADEVAQAYGDCSFQYRIPIFRNPYHMGFQVVQTM